MEALGVDVGGVITDRSYKDTKRWLDRGSEYLDTPLTPGVVEALTQLSGKRFGSQIYLISKCDQATQDNIRRFLHHINFFAQTGIQPEHVSFCETRAGKAPIVANLGLTHFVDDRLEVLGHMNTVKHRYLFIPDPTEVAAHRQHLPQVTAVQSWSDITRLLLPDR